MRLLPSLLIAALGGVVGVAPAAPVPLRQPAHKTKKTKSADEEKDSHRHDQGTIGHVVLRADTPRTGAATGAGGEARVTVDTAPALRSRRLPPAPPCIPPVRDLTADVSAGLFDTPPPRA